MEVVGSKETLLCFQSPQIKGEDGKYLDYLSNRTSEEKHIRSPESQVRFSVHTRTVF